MLWIENIIRIPELVPTLDVQDAKFDIVIIVTDKLSKLKDGLEPLKAPLEAYSQVCYYVRYLFNNQSHTTITNMWVWFI